jgi:hypothetical protein
MPEIFLSYVRGDASIARLIRNELEKVGIKTWSDENIKSGHDWEKEIRESLKRASMGIVLLSPSSLNSAHVAQEYQSILAQNKPLYVATIGNIEPQDIPYHLQLLELIDLSRDLDAGLAALKTAVQKGIQSPGNTMPKKRAKPHVTLTVEVDTEEIKVADVLSKLEHLLESDVQQIRVVNVEPGSDVLNQTRNSHPTD